MNLSYTVLSRQSTSNGTLEELLSTTGEFVTLMLLVSKLFIWGLFFISFLKDGETFISGATVVGQQGVGCGDIRNADELVDEAEEVEELPYGGEAKHAEQEDVLRFGE